MRFRAPRVDRWMQRMCEMFPELQEIEDEARAVEESDDPEAGMAGLVSKLSKPTLVERV